MDTISFFSGCVTGSFLTAGLACAIIIVAISKNSGRITQQEEQEPVFSWNGR